MKEDILDLNVFLRENRNQFDTSIKAGRPPKVVSNPIFFTAGTIPTEDGLFSHEIFGRPGSEERKFQFGYIDLKRKFLNPTFFKLFTAMDKNIENILLSKGYYRFENGKFVPDENGETGPSFFISHYKDLVIQNTGTRRRDTYVKLLEKTPESDLFWDKWPVIPPYLRDYSASESDPNEIKAVDQINDYYAKLIRYTNSLNPSGGFNFMEAMTEANIQQLIFDIYEYCLFKLRKKNGLFHRSLMGKSIDYAVRSVITAPRFKTNDPMETQIKYGYVGIPLSQVIVLFYPFFINYIQNFIDEYYTEITDYNEGKKAVKVSSITEQFSEDNIKRMMNLYIKSEDSRFKPIMIKADDGKEYPINLFRKDLGRKFTLTDLFYLAAVDIIADKAVYVTRYPVEVFQNIFPCKIQLLTTMKTKPQILGNKYLPDYPYIDDNYVVDEGNFVDSVRMHNSYLDAIGGDYDGDTVSIRAVYTKEANLEAEKLIYSKKNLLNTSGEALRTIGKEAVLAAYGLTKNPPNIKL